MKIATWNVNSIKARIDAAQSWIREAAPDILCLQEIKCESSAFPASAFEDLGYNVAITGQKTYNGVALLSKHPIEDLCPKLPGDETDEQARYLEAVIARPGGSFRVASLYLPNGNPPATAKYDYKLRWMARLREHAAELLKHEEALVLAGDYNVIPHPIDARFPDDWTGDALFLPETRARFRAIENLGLTDALRQVHGKAAGLYTFWDYQAGAWQRNNGIRIDHLLLSPQAADLLLDVRIDKHVRGWDRPPDHVPVVATFK